jgi:hypothetical protein
VTAVYGFEGPLITRLRSLDQALPPIGWELGDLARRQSWADLDPGMAAAADGLARYRTSWMRERQVNLTWRPTAALDYPRAAELMRPWGQPPLEPRMRATWSSRGQEVVGWPRKPGETPEPGVRTRNHLPLEISGPAVPELLDETFARNAHALTLTIEFSYYSNPNAVVRPHRIPRYLLPTPTGRQGGTRRMGATTVRSGQ